MYRTLKNGIQIPAMGIGTYQIMEKEILSTVIHEALDSGFPLIDTASAYLNERLIGKVLQEEKIPREQIFLQSKVWCTNYGYKETKEALKTTLRKMKTDYLDAYLIHWPAAAASVNEDTWAAMEDLYKEGLTKSIGICNCNEEQLRLFLSAGSMIPMIHQFEYHPGLLDRSVIELCRKHNIQIEASSPLGTGILLKHEVVETLAREKEKTLAQILLRFELQTGVIPLPKSSTRGHVKENFELFDFELTEHEMKQLTMLSGVKPSYGPPEAVNI